MTRLRGRLGLVPVLLTSLFLSGACNKDKGDESGQIKEIMKKLNDKSPESLSTLLYEELQVDPPDWGTIQRQTKEFAQLTASLGEHSPPKGSKESWAKLTKAYAESAAALDKAAQAKDKTAAQAAHKTLGRACMGCHQQHHPKGGLGGV
ncbi:MAG: cytochrome c [Planctomycetes bacterium]|nr:cytochrome c [Planctomycetota bacterium]